MFESIKKRWNCNGFEILLVICLVFICIYALTRIGKNGTWSTTYSYSPREVFRSYHQQRGPPKESRGEKECRRVLQKIFNKPFNKCRPNFLNNPVTGGRFNLELDCYEESLQLACEYNGEQHYKYIPYFHKNKEAFLNQKYRDDMKRRLCRENKTNLIEVPNTVVFDDIESFIRQILKNIGYIK